MNKCHYYICIIIIVLHSSQLVVKKKKPYHSGTYIFLDSFLTYDPNDERFEPGKRFKPSNLISYRYMGVTFWVMR